MSIKAETGLPLRAYPSIDPHRSRFWSLDSPLEGKCATYFFHIYAKIFLGPKACLQNVS